jgi:hypothetical protein
MGMTRITHVKVKELKKNILDALELSYKENSLLEDQAIGRKQFAVCAKAMVEEAYLTGFNLGAGKFIPAAEEPESKRELAKAAKTEG